MATDKKDKVPHVSNKGGDAKTDDAVLSRGMVADAHTAEGKEVNRVGYRYLGRAYKSLTGEVSGSRATDFPTGEGSTSKEVATVWRVSYIEDTEMLRQALRISAAGSYGEYGSVAVDFFRSVSIDRKTIDLLVEVDSVAAVAAQTEYKMSLRLKTDLATTEDNNAIYYVYGDRFVGEVKIGGRFYMYLRYSWQSVAEKEELKVKAKAAVGSFSIKGKYQSAMESLKTNKVESSYTEAYGVDLARPTVEEAYQYSLDFPVKVAESKSWVPLSVVTYPLANAEGWDINRARMDVSMAGAFLEALEKTRVEAERFRGQWQDVLDYPHHYVGESLDQARANIAELEDLAVNLKSTALAVLATPLQDKIEAKFSIAKACKELPVEVPRFAPTVVAHFETVTRDVHNGNGVATWSQAPLIVGMSDNVNTNWLCARSGSKRNIRKFGIAIVPDKKQGLAPPMLELRYRARYPSGDTEWASGGRKLQSLTHGGTLLILGVEFELAGEMADAYWIEYRVHCMHTGDGPVRGNTPGNTMGMATNQTYIEGIRLAIWPKD